MRKDLRRKATLETEICDEQFRRGRTNAIFPLRKLMKRHREVEFELHMISIDLEKAYERVPRQEIWRSMREKGVPEKCARIVKEISKILREFKIDSKIISDLLADVQSCLNLDENPGYLTRFPIFVLFPILQCNRKYEEIQD
ncbi:hypothetical protein J437_LFUL000155 [Ladona fulva]|uniref:Reverse transcriptase domain-containing protein n=1 Tax=Ladona fulva TaxID=123851 RepID=A0A8K0P3X9_LADFU|nr:hypothetical protein J437_LFUL000155 [Ladona fulva]